MNGNLINNPLNYVNNRKKKSTLIVDITDKYESETDKHILGSSGEFKIKLNEPLIIDKLSEVYLDNLITFNSNTSNDPSNSAFIVNIDQFNIKTTVASNASNIKGSGVPDTTHGNDILSNKIIIPNENNSLNNHFATVAHKAKKLNYICDIPPTRITKLSGKITNLNGDPIFYGNFPSNNYIYYLNNIEWRHNGSDSDYDISIDNTWTNASNASAVFDNNASMTHVPKNTEFVLWGMSGGTSAQISCVLLHDLSVTGVELYFSTSALHSYVKHYQTNASDLNILFSTKKIQNIDADHGGTPATTSDNVSVSIRSMNLYAQKIPGKGDPSLFFENGRFLAEFSIISDN